MPLKSSDKLQRKNKILIKISILSQDIYSDQEDVMSGAAGDHIGHRMITMKTTNLTPRHHNLTDHNPITMRPV